jgi:small subunit ribosomal protein S20
VPHHKSCKKRLITSQKSNVRNSQNRAALRTAFKQFRSTIGEATDEQKTIELRKMYSMIDTNTRKGLMPRSRAARLKGRFAAAVSK